ncbi:MAG TPA: ubiquitin-like domain-containing protein [Candidatus Saccharimonadales bacterium]|nr:ubiquitin-like domain-containing protein [Candidatus Saccharimonadales bacterium]
MEVVRQSLLGIRGFWWAGALVIAALLAGVFAFAPTQSHAENERVVTIYHDEHEKTVVTDATTVESVLQRAGITLGAHDAVEPALTTELSAPSYNINIYRARPVTIIDGAKKYTVSSPYSSPHTIAEAAGIALQDEDLLELTRSDDLLGDGAGLKLSIDRATPVVLVLYGVQKDVYTQSASVGDFLQEKGITLGQDDGMNTSLNTSITAGLKIEVWRNGVQTLTLEQDVAFATETIRDTGKPVGFKEVKEPGKAGKKLVTYEVEMRNGVEVNRKEIQSVVTQQATKQVEVIGVQLGFTGAFQEALARLRACEAGGRYDRNSGNGYYGAYQYDISTWANYQGYARADLAPPEVQDQKAYETYKRRGWQPWPSCRIKLGLQDIYR